MWYSRLSWRCRSPYSYGFSYDIPVGRDGEPPMTPAQPRPAIAAAGMPSLARRYLVLVRLRRAQA